MKRILTLVTLFLTIVSLAPIKQATAQGTPVDSIIANVMKDLGQRIGLPNLTPTNIKGTWSYQEIVVLDNSLGCPQSKQNIPGQDRAWQFTITVFGVGTFDYRATKDGTILFPCSGPGIDQTNLPTPTPEIAIPPTESPVLSPNTNLEPTTFQAPVLAYIGVDGNVMISSLSINTGPVPITGDANRKKSLQSPFFDATISYHSLRWSPDGNSLAFLQSTQNGQSVQTSVYVVSSGKAPVRVALGVAGQYPPAWSPDGSELAFVVPTGQNVGPGVLLHQVQAVPAVGGQPRAVGSFTETFGDGGYGLLDPSLVLYSLETRIPLGQSGQLVWTANGFVHTALANGRGLVLTNFAGQNVWEERLLLRFAISPDRTHAVAKEFEELSQPQRAVILDLKTGAKTPFANINPSGDLDQFAWSADGTIIYYSTRVPANSVVAQANTQIAQQGAWQGGIRADSFTVKLSQAPFDKGIAGDLFTQEGYGIGTIAPSPSTAAVLFSFVESSIPLMQYANANGSPADALNRFPFVKIGVAVPDSPNPPIFFDGGQPAFSTATAGFVAIPAPGAPNTETISNTGVVCPGTLPSRLIVGQLGRVTPGEPNALNSKAARPSLDPTSTRLTSIPAGGIFTILSGPVCAGSYAWWQVNYNGIIGWTAEGDASVYWLDPVQ
jgi:hypothetical protein